MGDGLTRDPIQTTTVMLYCSPCRAGTAVSTTLSPMEVLSCRESYMTLTAVLLSNVASIAAAVALFRLTVTVHQSQRLAWWSAVAFSWGPHSVFLSASYTEGLFAAACFFGLEQLYLAFPSNSSPRLRNMFMSTASLTACTLIRSNGNLLALFPAALVVRELLGSGPRDTPDIIRRKVGRPRRWLRASVTILCVAAIVSISLLWQVYTWTCVCSAATAAVPTAMKVPDYCRTWSSPYSARDRKSVV